MSDQLFGQAQQKPAPVALPRPAPFWLIGPLLGVAFFIAMFDVKLLNPTAIDWLLRNEDSRMQFIGWHFFFHEPWQMPPGAARQYGMEIGSAIVFSDAIPLLALAFKALRQFLPDKFQYMGLWILLCYVAQGSMAWLLSGTITSRGLQRGLITAFFVMSPLMLYRAFAHHALMGHWLVLAALYLYVRPYDSRWNRRWMVLLCLAALVNAYLQYLAMGIWAADVVRRAWIDRSLTVRKLAVETAMTAAALLCTMWLAGYFTVSVRDFSNSTSDYGRFAANLNSFWNPGWLQARFLPRRPLLPDTEIESALYLGVGVIAILAVAAVALIRSRPKPPLIQYLPLLLLAAVFSMLAVSHRVAFGDTILFTVPLPTSVLGILASVRGSARMMWVVYYGLILGGAAVVVRTFRPLTASAILTAGLVIQMADVGQGYVILRRSLHEAFTVKTDAAMKSLQSPFWSTAARHYQRIRFVPVANKPPDYDALALFAADHGMSINVGYFGRVSSSRLDSANAELGREVGSRKLRRDSLYVFWHDAPPANLDVSDGVGVVDGFRVVAPGWFESVDCCADLDGVLKRAGDSAPSLPLDVHFGNPLTRRLLRTGWNQDESRGGQSFVWSSGNQSELTVPLPADDDIRLAFECAPFIFPGSPQQSVSISLNGTSIGEVVLQSGDAVYSTTLPSRLLVNGDNTLELRYRYSRRPDEAIPGSTDTRSLAVRWLRMSFERVR